MTTQLQPKTRVLVTGATGFLGRNVLRALQARPEVEPIAACRSPGDLSTRFTGEVRTGDLLDPGYRIEVVQNIDVVCHAGTWGAFWGHADLERTQFFEPAIDLVECAIRAGVRRFIQNSTVVVAAPAREGVPIDDFAPGRPTGFWPHLDRLIELEKHLKANSQRGTQMITLRLGHFAGSGNQLGLVSALTPRLRTYLVPWLAGGHAHLPLVADTDLGEAFALAAIAPDLDPYESFNICGAESPTAREVFSFIAAETNSPRPFYSVPYFGGYAFGWLMETLHPVLPGSAPFLTRSIVHVAENWVCATDRARRKLGYIPRKDWRTAVRESLVQIKADGFPWRPLAQKIPHTP